MRSIKEFRDMRGSRDGKKLKYLLRKQNAPEPANDVFRLLTHSLRPAADHPRRHQR